MILLPNIPLVKISILSQVVNGIVLPFVLIFMLLLINKSELMGKHVNGTWFNAIAWATTIIMIVLTVAWLVGGGSGIDESRRRPVGGRFPGRHRGSRVSANPCGCTQRTS